MNISPDFIDVILNAYFDIRPMGVEVCDGVEPPKEAWEALILHLAGNNDNLRWQIAAACNRYPKKYRVDAYTLAASRFNCSRFTIEQYAHIERSIPYSSRVNGLSIWFHKLVTGVADPTRQREHLEYCHRCGMSETAFENYLQGQGVIIPEHKRQSDREFEEQQEILKVKTENAESKHKISELESTVEVLTAKLVTSQETAEPPNEDRNSYVMKAIGEIKYYLSEDEFRLQYSGVTIYADGRVMWIP